MQRFIDAGLVSPERAAALHDEHDLPLRRVAECIDGVEGRSIRSDDPCDALRNALTASRGDRSGPMFILTSSSGIGHLSKPRASGSGAVARIAGTAPFVDCPFTHCAALRYLAANPKPTTVCDVLTYAGWY